MQTERKDVDRASIAIVAWVENKLIVGGEPDAIRCWFVAVV